ncbi:MAG TPA: hypothetical protein VIW29_07555 [Polyangiaceae bacterium]
MASLLGCSKDVPLAAPAAPLTKPTRLCGEHEGPPHCRPAAQVEKLLGDELEILSMADTPSGSQGAMLLTLRAPRHGTVLRVKWRPQSGADVINEPRKELAACAVQRLFLEPDELVAPPTVAHCFALEKYRVHVPKAKPSFHSIDCVLGFASLWLEDVQSVGGARKDGLLSPGDGIWDPGLFAKDALYRSSVGKANLLTYLINHGDAHSEQFMLERAPGGLRTYVVDSSIAFLSIKNPMLLLRQDWSSIQLPKLPPRPIQRLAKLTDADYARLACATTLVRHDRQLTTEHQPHCAPGDTTMSWQGERLRIGLSKSEIELVRQRVGELLQRPDLAQLTDSSPARP